MAWFDKKDDVQPVELEPAEFRQNVEIVKDDYERLVKECEAELNSVEKSWNTKLDEIEQKWKAKYDKLVEDERVQTSTVRGYIEQMRAKIAEYEEWLSACPKACRDARELVKENCKAELEAFSKQKDLAMGCLKQEYQDKLNARKPIMDKMQKAMPVMGRVL